MSTLPVAPLFARIVDDLATHGWSQQTIFIPTDLTTLLAAECQSRAQRGQLEPAAVGGAELQKQFMIGFAAITSNGWMLVMMPM